MGATGTDRRIPANMRRLAATNGELPAYVSTDGRHVIVLLAGKGNGARVQFPSASSSSDEASRRSAWVDPRRDRYAGRL